MQSAIASIHKQSVDEMINEVSLRKRQQPIRAAYELRSRRKPDHQDHPRKHVPGVCSCNENDMHKVL
jgi:hypothetical protein